MKQQFYIDPDITKAETLPASFYQSEAIFEKLKHQVFRRSWQWIGDRSLAPLSGSIYPFSLLDGFVTEPMVLVRNQSDQLSCLSNVCTHRANIIARHPAEVKELACVYHGRRFDLNGRFKFMPEFKEAALFPRRCEDLYMFPLEDWGGQLFTSVDPSFDFGGVLQVMNKRIGFLPLDQFKRDDTKSKDYLVKCHWALYCDNYLEGFHIPFVHSDLNAVLDYGNYTTLLYDFCSLQIGYSDGGEEIFNLPEGHPDAGKEVAAYYFWIYPNMMFNFYPWGLSVNIVKPINRHQTRVSFISYIYDESKIASGAGAALDKVEREDEFVVEGVHQGIQSSAYKTGRFSPKMEKGVHHFHQLLARYVNES